MTLESPVGRRPYLRVTAVFAKVRAMSRPLRPSSARCAGALWTALLMASIAGCRDSGASFGTPDSGTPPTTTTCTENADCGGRGVCVSGLCEAVTACQADEECAAQGRICHSSRGFCVQCDGVKDACPAGQACQFDFTCVAVGAPDAGASGDGGANACTGTCTDRTQCGADQVCRGGTCCEPRARCTTPEDCPSSRPECNGATGLCFGGDSCTGDGDCDRRAGCGGGACFCDAPAPGQPGVCKPRPNDCDDDTGCYMGGVYSGKFCTLGATPRRCADAPSCAEDVDCASVGLVCDTTAGSPSNGRCVNGPACPMGNECTPTQLCDQGRCAGRSCVTDPSLCNAMQICNSATGRCETSQSGACMRDMDCNPGFYCNTTANVCLPGCRDSSECTNGICNASHVCEQGMGALCGPCTTDADCPAGTTCYESPITMSKTCRESCNVITGQDCTIDPSATCIILRCACGP